MAMNIIKKLLIAPFACLALGSVLSGCGSATDEIDCSRTIFTPRDRSKMSDVERYVQDYFGEKYNVDIRYRYEDRFASNQYKLGPTDEMKALNYLNLIRYTFFDVYDKVAPAGLSSLSSSVHVGSVLRRTSSGKLLTAGFRSTTSMSSRFQTLSITATGTPSKISI